MNTTITPPEGATQFETVALTGEELRGATIHGTIGESVGDISDFVFDSSTSTAAAGPNSGGAATGTDTGGAPLNHAQDRAKPLQNNASRAAQAGTKTLLRRLISHSPTHEEYRRNGR